MGANSSSKAAAGPSVLDHESIWAGHQVVFGKRSIPVLGDIETRTDTWVLADVTEKEDGFVLRQRACHITFAPVMGVEVHIKPTALSLLPQATIHFSQTAPGRFEAEPWIVAWATEDRDRDGNPGVTIQATSSLCTGSLYVASANTSWARGRKVGGALKGQIRVRVQQEVLDASTWCLRAGSKNTDELQQGQFAYTPVPPGTTCANLRRRGWPVSAGK